MEDQLRKTLTDLERREKKLATSEQEVICYYQLESAPYFII